MEPEYLKVIDEHIVYYINKKYVTEIDLSIKNQLMALSEIVINKRTNELLKYRFPIGDLIDNILHKDRFLPKDKNLTKTYFENAMFMRS